MRKISKYLMAYAVGLLLIQFFGCTRAKSYEEVLAEEMTKEDRCDSLFYGIHFNMTTPAFMDHCFEMNQQKIFYQYGVGSMIVIKFKNEFKYPVEFKFYPNLEKNLIQILDGRFLYEGRNAFSKERDSNVLILDVVTQMEKWYGGRKFIKIPPSEQWQTDSYVKIDGNRKITLEQDLVTGEVKVRYEDMKKIL